MRSKRAPEEVAAWKERMGHLLEQVRRMSKEEREALTLSVGIIGINTCEGHHLSAFNTCFLAAQAGDRLPSIIGGFRQWKRAGRTVDKGQHAIGFIYVPLGSKKDNDTDADVEGDSKGKGMRFRLVPVFDVSQTSEA